MPASAAATANTDMMIAGGVAWKQCIASGGGPEGILRARSGCGVRLPGSAMLRVSGVHAAERQGGSNGVALKPKKKEETAAAAPSPSPGAWSLGSWRGKKKVLGGQENNGSEKLEQVGEMMASYPPLVFAGEVRHLEEKLGEAALGRSFLLQGGDCCEHDIFNSTDIRDTFRVLLQMAVVLMFGGQMPVVKVGRLAAHLGKAGSTEFVAGEDLSEKGKNGHELSGEQEVDSDLIIRAYSQSAASLNLLRSFATGGYAAMQRVTKWNLDFTVHSDQGYRYLELARRVNEALGFMSALGITGGHPIMTMTDFWTSHECVSLSYEEALTRLDSTTGRWYDCSTHMLWVGERACQLHGAHLEFLRGIENPLGIKVSDKMEPSELVRVCKILNPENRPGRLTIITHMGAQKLRQKLPQLIRAINQAGLIVTWVTDPMHGYTINASSGLKTRSFQDILDEVQAFFDVHEEEGSHAGGVHLEMTGQNVSECQTEECQTETEANEPLDHPRLNASQSLELAFIIASRLRKHRAHLHSHLLPI